MDAASVAPQQKQHRPSRSKVKAKAKAKSGQSSSASRNAVAKPGAFMRRLRLTADRKERRLSNPTLPPSRPVVQPPPRVVAVVGPPRVGKTTIISNLVKHFSKRSIPTVAGPITVVATPKRRFTFLEVASDLPSMIDAAKIADLVLLVIDASYGFEMDTFEFLNIAAAHGMPKVLAVLTHLDKLRDGKQQRRAKKQFKNRIWAELYEGAKVFYLSGITTTGHYLNRDVLNLARFISVSKPSRIRWRAGHPYLLADRVEDVSSATLPPHANRTVAVYGYLRGAPLRPLAGTWNLHLAGVADLTAHNITKLPDPCPPPPSTKFPEQNVNSDQMKPSRRTLNQRHRALYAPMAPQVDGIAYDRDAVYIDIDPTQVRFTDKSALQTFDDNDAAEQHSDSNEDPLSSDGEGEKMVKHLQKTTSQPVDRSLAESELRLLADAPPLVSEDFSGPKPDRRPLEALTPSSEAQSDSGEEPDDEDDFDDSEDDSDDESEGSEMSQSDDEESVGEPQNVLEVRKKLARNKEPVPGALIKKDTEKQDDGSSEGENSSEDDSDGSDDADDGSIDRSIHGDEQAALRWKKNMLDTAASRLRNSRSPSVALTRYIYEDVVDSLMNPKEDDDESEGENDLLSRKRVSLEAADDNDAFFTPKRSRVTSAKDVDMYQFSDAILEDLTRRLPHTCLDWISQEEQCAVLKRMRFGTGQNRPGENDLGSSSIDGDSDAMDDFKDVEGSSSTGDASVGGNKAEQTDLEDIDSDKEKADLMEEKMRKKKEFDKLWDQKDLNNDAQSGSDEDDVNSMKRGPQKRPRKPRKEEGEGEPDFREVERTRLQKLREETLAGLDAETRAGIEGYQPGDYIRVELQDVPMEFVKFFDSRYPVVLGGLKQGEDEGRTYVRARIRRHRFKRGVLKSNDAMVMSIGWRRFQSLPVYDMEDQGGRRRFIKYSPEYMHCHATFWAPRVSPGAGVIMCQSLGRDRGGFRICGSGIVTEVDTDFKITKKLKLVGEAVKVLKNTAFIKGMFNSEAEVSKYIGARIRTVSGIRGTIKKAVSESSQRAVADRDLAKSGSGTFRAGFEDKILLSDVVFLRAWVPVEVSKFCSIATTLLDKERDGKGGWRMRTVREVRQEKQLSIPLSQDSLYKGVERMRPQFGKLKVSKKLEAALPFATKSKDFGKKRSDKRRKKEHERKVTEREERAVVVEKEERNEQRLLQAVYTIRNERGKKRKESQQRQLATKKKAWAREEAKHAASSAARRKRKFALNGAQEARKAKRSRAD